MKISTKGRYGTRFMLDLAMHYDQGAISLKDIAARQGISDKYLEQIVPLLARSELIRSVRGPQGGYMLAKDSSDITVGMILRVLEGSLAPVECVQSGEPHCPRAEQCVTIGVWRKMYDAMQAVVDDITLAQLVEDALAKNM